MLGRLKKAFRLVKPYFRTLIDEVMSSVFCPLSSSFLLLGQCVGIPFSTAGSSRKAYRECLENGSWRRRENSSEPWRDDSECVEEQYFKDTVSCLKKKLIFAAIELTVLA